MKISGKRNLRGRADYGIDAPRTVRSMAILGSALIAAGRIAALFGKRSITAAGIACDIAGIAALGVTGSHIAYALSGKHALRNRLIDMIEWRGDECVLDIGTGRGLLMIGAAHRLSTGAATGIDIWNAHELSGNTAESALRNAEVEGVRAKVQVRTEDARRLGAGDDAFDVILSLRCLHHISGIAERAAACREIARVLKPGGTALIADSTATNEFVAMLSGAGLIVERSRPFVRTTFAYLRVVAATKPL